MLSLLPCESPVSMKENLDKKKYKKFKDPNQKNEVRSTIASRYFSTSQKLQQRPEEILLTSFQAFDNGMKKNWPGILSVGNTLWELNGLWNSG